MSRQRSGNVYSLYRGGSNLPPGPPDGGDTEMENRLTKIETELGHKATKFWVGSVMIIAVLTICGYLTWVHEDIKSGIGGQARLLDRQDQRLDSISVEVSSMKATTESIQSNIRYIQNDVQHLRQKHEAE